MEKFYADKRYHTLDYFFKEKFGRKVAKIPLSGGFTCPNRDGTKGTGGCIYCSANLSGDALKKSFGAFLIVLSAVQFFADKLQKKAKTP